ncbi:hypothetical protein K6672_000620 [Vibrio vulnificus]|nr:hypothetical protein [Vibrio parahaemolyticus]EHU4917144.1 hypothetical protein [Vibrio vulnificus]EGQ8699953.1 hypothetical protein [Vibrio parahaemolyticus]EGQ8751260.1 hypothetical protein [Vibrio parahaemolyticus]EGQ8759330.1 hypothetical protein [Vibrio parahaemolyticus]
MELDKFDEALGFYTRIDSRLGGVALSYLATIEKISEVSQTPWQDESLSRYEQKIRMKEVGGATFQFIEFLHENAIMSLAKVIEDTSIELKRFAKFKFDSVKNHHEVIYLKELQTIRALANVIKHNVSYLERSSSESAKFLVDECGMTNGYTLDSFILSRHNCFNIVEYIPQIYLAMCSLVEKALDTRHPVLDLEYEDAFDKIYESLIPEVIKLDRPNKAFKTDSQRSALSV